MSATRRKLTTIFSADVQGYTRLMEADEEGTLATLKQYRDAIARLIDSHGGRVVNTWGDGLIAEFPSVVESVRTAIDVQNELAGHNAVRPAATQMRFRIGINLGDVMVEGSDIYGDGVNIAARLQTSAPAGGIVISNTVYDQVRNKMAVGFEFLGDLVVKNLEEGVPSYAVRIGGQESKAAPAPPRAEPAATPLASDAPTRDAAGAGASLERRISRKFLLLGFIALGLAAINLLSWNGIFWAQWPILAVSLLAGLRLASTTSHINRGIAILGAVALAVVAVNLLSWQGEFWAKWPLLGIVLAGGIGWAIRKRG
ncbi:adenylate/guanylate cyclase domain-containing protein [Mesorhizobium sp. B283B1A]|uniref:adenylate/guanylate cyclase domain-containing protein n=1 Tax=Mesorhizobium TaxID=68287 RepID=UPI001CD18B90|nr:MULTISPECIES: adenylate/guanylate cyclase domain-containing protein [Mesorhizobium]MCA0049353.1 adenylate/guanylate cyclase domain-containing protein [Mesorhizobium sp. B283B1A]UQS66506.1 adenylate/guanylate cyclase domain-containing protein [Mesorhizobium opportunistum]